MKRAGNRAMAGRKAEKRAGCRDEPHVRRANGAYRLAACDGRHERQVEAMDRRGRVYGALVVPPDEEAGLDAKGYRRRRRAASAVPGGWRVSPGRADG